MASKIKLNSTSVCSKCGSLNSDQDTVCNNCKEEFSSEMSLEEIGNLILLFQKDDLTEEEVEGTAILLNDVLKNINLEINIVQNPLELLKILDFLYKTNDNLIRRVKNNLNEMKEGNNSKIIQNLFADLTFLESVNGLIKNTTNASINLSNTLFKRNISTAPNIKTENVITEEEWLEEHRKVQEDLIKLREEIKSSNSKKKEYEAKIKELESELDEMKKTESEVKRILKVLDELLGKLPKDVIENFAMSEDFDLYKKLMIKLGLA